MIVVKKEYPLCEKQHPSLLDIHISHPPFPLHHDKDHCEEGYAVRDGSVRFVAVFVSTKRNSEFRRLT